MTADDQLLIWQSIKLERWRWIRIHVLTICVVKTGRESPCLATNKRQYSSSTKIVRLFKLARFTGQFVTYDYYGDIIKTIAN